MQREGKPGAAPRRQVQVSPIQFFPESAASCHSRGEAKPQDGADKIQFRSHAAASSRWSPWSRCSPSGSCTCVSRRCSALAYKGESGPPVDRGSTRMRTSPSVGVSVPAGGQLGFVDDERCARQADHRFVGEDPRRTRGVDPLGLRGRRAVRRLHPPEQPSSTMLGNNATVVSDDVPTEDLGHAPTRPRNC